MTYTAQDAAGNVAEPATRRVRVVCPAEEFICHAQYDPALLYCSTATLCVDPIQRGAPTPRVMSTIKLLGAATIYINQYSVYTVCPSPRPVDILCERGASAQHPLEGPLDRYVAACDPNAQFSRYGLRACDLDTSLAGACRVSLHLPCLGPMQRSLNDRGALAAGTYSIDFYVRDSATRRLLSVTRQVVVLPQCKVGQDLCADRVCSSMGTCFQGHWQDPSPINLSPTLTLRPVLTAAASDVVRVPHGAQYVPCGPGGTPTPKVPCEPGAVLPVCIVTRERVLLSD